MMVRLDPSCRSELSLYALNRTGISFFNYNLYNSPVTIELYTHITAPSDAFLGGFHIGGCTGLLSPLYCPPVHSHPIDVCY